MPMTLRQVRDRLRAPALMFDSDRRELADAIDAHMAAVREVIAELRANVSPLDGYHSPKFHALADKLEAVMPKESK